MSSMNPLVDEYFKKAKLWRVEMEQLRRIALECELTEELKWKAPCYTFQNANVAMIGGFKASCVLSFFKGALLKDTKGILEKPGENSQAARVIRFTGLQKVLELEPVLRAYLKEAVKVEKAGLKVDFKQNQELDLPTELQAKLDESSELAVAFEALSPGRQRGYALFIAGAKQSKTRAARVEKYRQQILDGKGIHDCTCGLSKKMPSCDGSHKAIR